MLRSCMVDVRRSSGPLLTEVMDIQWRRVVRTRREFCIQRAPAGLLGQYKGHL